MDASVVSEVAVGAWGGSGVPPQAMCHVHVGVVTVCTVPSVGAPPRVLGDGRPSSDA